MDERANARLIHGTQINFSHVLVGVKNYGDVRTTISKTIIEMRAEGFNRFGFVSGRIGSRYKTDPALRLRSIKDDMAKMRRYTEHLRKRYGIPIFSSVDIFDTVWQELEETQLSPQERSFKMKELFREILKSGITDIYMMNGWEQAPGAVDENETAKEIGLTIHDPEKIESADD